MVTSVVSILIASRAVLTIADTDLWGHVRFGQDILRIGAVPLQDTYSYLTGSSKWINHEWLAEVIFALFYNAGGAPALVALKSFFVIVISLLLWRTLLKGGFGLVSAAAFMIFIQVLLASAFPPLRPNLFSCLFITLELLILTAYAKKIVAAERSLIILFLPVLFLFWANSHGGFIMGLIILMVWWLTVFAETIWSRNWQRLIQQGWPFFMIVPITVAATIVNPYGCELLSYLVRTNGVVRTFYMKGPFVSEWQPLFKVSIVYGAYYVITAAFTIASLFFSRRPKHLGLLMVWLMLAAVALIIYRALPLFGIATVILASTHLADCWSRLYINIAEKRYAYWMVCTAISTAVFFSAAGLMSQLSGIPGQLVFCIPMPVRAVSLLKQMKSQANTLVEFNWAEYFIWHLGPQMKVAIDPRCETVYSDYCLYYLYGQFVTADRHWDDIIDKYPTDLVLIGPNTKVSQLMELKSGWVKIYADSTCCLFAKEGSQIQKRFKAVTQINFPESATLNTFP